jgi:hypothetical protein
MAWGIVLGARAVALFLWNPARPCQNPGIKMHEILNVHLVRLVLGVDTATICNPFYISIWHFLEIGFNIP